MGREFEESIIETLFGCIDGLYYWNGNSVFILSGINEKNTLRKKECEIQQALWLKKIVTALALIDMYVTCILIIMVLILSIAPRSIG